MPSNSKNITKEPEDILAEVDKVRKAPPTPRLRRASAEEKTAAAVSAGSHRPFFIIGGVIFIVIIAGIAGYIMLSSSVKYDYNIIKTNINVNSQKTNINAINNSNISPNANSAINTNSTAKITNDTDGDGYNDGEEIKTLNDPKVPGGKLLDLQRAIQSLNTNK